MSYTLQQKLDTLRNLNMPASDDVLLQINTTGSQLTAATCLKNLLASGSLEDMYRMFIYLRATFCVVHEFRIAQRRPLVDKLELWFYKSVDDYLKTNMPDYEFLSRWFDSGDCTSEVFPKNEPWIINTRPAITPVMSLFTADEITYDSLLIHNGKSSLIVGGDHRLFYAVQLIGFRGDAPLCACGVNYTQVDPSTEQYGYSRMKLRLESMLSSKEKVFNNPLANEMSMTMFVLLVAAYSKELSEK